MREKSYNSRNNDKDFNKSAIICVVNVSVSKDEPCVDKQKQDTHAHTLLVGRAYEIEEKKNNNAHTFHGRYSYANFHTMTTFNANTTLEEGELEQTVCSLTEKSWYEECEKDEMTVSTICCV